MSGTEASAEGFVIHPNAETARLQAESATGLFELAQTAVAAATAGDVATADSCLQTVAWRSGVLAAVLRGAAERLGKRDAASLRAHERAERRIQHHVDGVQVAAFDTGFAPKGFFVYCLWGADGETPLYVGQSTNILSRLGSHLGNPERRNLITRVTVLRCASKKLMCDTEMRLISQYQPQWNTVGIRPSTVVPPPPMVAA